MLMAGILEVWEKHATPKAELQTIAPQQASALIQGHLADQNFVLLDVRTPEEFAGGHLKNALNLNFHAPTFRNDLAKLDRNKTYLVYCRSGNRSQQAMTAMGELKFVSVYNMQKGIIGWVNEKLPIVK